MRKPLNCIAALKAWKADALSAMRMQDEAFKRLQKVIPSRYLGSNIWEAAADYIERNEKEKSHAA